MADILYLGWNRLEFTRKSFETMLQNTEWDKVERLLVYDDGSTDGTKEYLEEQIKHAPVEASLCHTMGIGPVGIMIDYLRRTGEDDRIFAKIDNDVMLPPGWLGECLKIMSDNPTIDLLGIEAMRPLGPGPRRFYPDEHIGGIGLMRNRAFRACAPAPNGRFGFTKWQTSHDRIVKGWLDPSLPVCLLNLVPFDPWRSLSLQYIEKGWQRDWPGPMPKEFTKYWEWWA